MNHWGFYRVRTIRNIKRYLKNPKKLILTLVRYGWFHWLLDKSYLKLIYWGEMGKKFNLQNPKTYNEKLQWLKLYDRNPEFSIYADKFDVRKQISETIGDKFLIPLLGVYNSVEEINWNALPNQFVLKCTHGSGANYISSDKNKLNIKEAQKKLRSWKRVVL